jgi:epoxide hydrolase
MRSISFALLGVCVSLGVAASALDVKGASPPVALPSPGAAAGAVQAAGTAAVVPFSIRVPDAVLIDLKERLARARFPAEITGTGWTQGADLAYMKELVAYWRDRFDWREQERRLNRFEQFTTNIDGVDIHFIHRRSSEPNALPLIISHGWPGSFAEFAKIIEPLTDPAAHGGRREDAFSVVIPSIPGYGFSEKPTEPGYHPRRIAELYAKLMARLGYSRYGAQGGDFGSTITRALAVQDGSHMLGLHLNFCTGGAPSPEAAAALPAAERQKVQSRLFAASTEEQGYSTMHGTRPQTLGYALDDSPVGLAAWIVEKMRAWCDCDGDIENRFTRDEILTNVMLYWVTQTGTSSFRLYYEARHAPPADPGRIEVPTACAIFPKEVIYAPRVWLEPRMNLVRWTEMPRGGHFPALEQPELLVDDVRAFFRTVR